MVVSNLNEGENSFCRLAENLPRIVCKEFIEIMVINMVQTLNGYNHKHLKQIRI